VLVSLVDYGTERFPASAIIAQYTARSNLLSLSEGLIAIAYVIGVFLFLAIVFRWRLPILQGCFGWLERVENVMHFLLILASR